jgi:hypothetical protein
MSMNPASNSRLSYGRTLTDLLEQADPSHPASIWRIDPVDGRPSVTLVAFQDSPRVSLILEAIWVLQNETDADRHLLPTWIPPCDG